MAAALARADAAAAAVQVPTDIIVRDMGSADTLDASFHLPHDGGTIITPGIRDNKVITIRVQKIEGRWFHEGTLRLTWKKDAAVREQIIPLRLRFRSSGNVEIDAHFYDGKVTERDLRKHEMPPTFGIMWKRMVYGAWAFEKISAVFRPTDQTTGRVANVWFTAMYEAAITEPYVVMMPEGATRAINAAYPSDTDVARRRDLANEARSMYWYDLKRVPELLKAKRCADVDVMLTELDDLKTRESSIFLRRYKAEDDPVGQARLKYKAACP